MIETILFLMYLVSVVFSFCCIMLADIRNIRQHLTKFDGGMFIFYIFISTVPIVNIITSFIACIDAFNISDKITDFIRGTKKC